MPPLIIGIAGGTASGKTTLARKVVSLVDASDRIRLLSTDSFYRPLTDDEHRNVAGYNFDEPPAIDWEWLYRSLQDLIDGRDTIIPQYDFTTHTRSAVQEHVRYADVIIVEGILLFCEERIRDLCDIKVFMTADDDVRLARRLQRDIVERGRTVESVLNQYMKTVKPSYNRFVLPSMIFADIIIPDRGHNGVSTNVLLQSVRARLSHPTDKV
ncbi:Uridine kinase [Plasmodiophora brassicae]